MKVKFSQLALFVTMAFSVGVSAAETATIAVDASVAEACSVGSGNAIALGSLQMINADGAQATANDVATNTFPAICTNGTLLPTFSYASANADGAAFRLIGATVATEFIEYTLHQDTTAALSAVTQANAAAHPAFLADGTSQNLDLAAKVIPAQKAGKSVQAYSDTITITVAFGAP